MTEKLWRFIDNCGSFESVNADKIKSLYFPLANEKLMSSITPCLHGDIKTGQNSFLLTPVSRIDLTNSKSSRNFWIYIDKHKAWSACGEGDRFKLEAGLLWHKVTRENKNIGLRAEILSFVPATPRLRSGQGGEPVEIMQVKISNISSRKLNFIPTSAIPIYARSANNLRDHRQVSSLLQRISLEKFGVIVKPTLTFDEAGHRPNKQSYFVLGWDDRFNPPHYLYPTQEMFCQEWGDLEAPGSVFKNLLPSKQAIQGKEAMGGLRFAAVTLTPGQSKSYIILMGITEDSSQIKKIIHKFNSLEKIKTSLDQTKYFWQSYSRRISLSTGNSDFDNWFQWVNIQPTLRRIFGCSFLPDFDYGKGGRGWRDLWQDCLGNILNNPKPVRSLLVNNFSGVRIDGSNATIIGKKPGEFIADRNNISRVWMDHGLWSLLTLDLYLNETSDFKILFENTSYFRNHEVNRTKKIDPNWAPEYGTKLKTATGDIYQGTVLEHLLVQNLVQFFNVGSHNHLHLEGGDWNDGLDMAKEKGESVALSAMYAYNLKLLSELLLKIDKPKIKIAQELKILLRKINYNQVKAKQKVLAEYFAKTKSSVSGSKVDIDTAKLATDLAKKSQWLMEHIRKREWLKQGFFNGYYDNLGRRIEGKANGLVKMMLASQVFPIMAGVAENQQMLKILASIKKYLFDKKLSGIHLNTDFRQEQLNLGRAFSFVYGDKENGAFFNHMIVMLAYGLYKQGLIRQGWEVLSSIYNMAIDTASSKIYPCLPEYFNAEGRGMYSYLTGSASWFVLTMVNEVFGVKGESGDLLIEPKLTAEQFKQSANLSIQRSFAGKDLKINFYNPQKLDYGKYRMVEASLNSKKLPLQEPCRMVIKRSAILKLSKQKINTLNITLG